MDSLLWVKICGLMQPEQAVEIARLGAQAIGMIGVPASPRYVTPLQMRAISQALQMDAWARSHRLVERVGVFADASMETLAEAVEVGQLTTLQLHGNETPATCAAVKVAFPHIKLIKAMRIRTTEDLPATQPFWAIADALLLDAYHPQLMGGTGRTLDWSSLKTFHPDIPWILAGGLTPDNVQAALLQVSPNGIDLSSGVETHPGNKSLNRVQALFKNLQPEVSP